MATSTTTAAVKQSAGGAISSSKKKTVKATTAPSPSPAPPPTDRSTTPKKTPPAPKKKAAVADVAAEGPDADHAHKYQKPISEAFAERVMAKYEKDEGSLPPGVTKKFARAFLISMIDMIADDLVHGKETSITNFVTFKRGVRYERFHRNPKDKEGKEQIFKETKYICKAEYKDRIKMLVEAVPVSPEDAEKARLAAEKTAARTAVAGGNDGLHEEDDQ